MEQMTHKHYPFPQGMEAGLWYLIPEDVDIPQWWTVLVVTATEATITFGSDSDDGDVLVRDGWSDYYKLGDLTNSSYDFPTTPGYYTDSDGDLWLVSSDGRAAILAEGEDTYDAKWHKWSAADIQYAPFTHVVFVPKKEYDNYQALRQEECKQCHRIEDHKIDCGERK